jgi:hypothetical protein
MSLADQDLSSRADTQPAEEEHAQQSWEHEGGAPAREDDGVFSGLV